MCPSIAGNSFLFFFFADLQGIHSIVGSVGIDMGVVTTPQLHWMVRARNKGMKGSELDYIEQLSSSFRLSFKMLI